MFQVPHCSSMLGAWGVAGAGSCSSHPHESTTTTWIAHHITPLYTPYIGPQFPLHCLFQLQKTC